MPLNKASLTAALIAGFQQGMDDPDWTTDQAAAAMADAIDAFVRGADVIGVETEVVDLGANPIGTGSQTGTGGLA